MAVMYSRYRKPASQKVFNNIEDYGARVGNSDNRKAIQNCIDSSQGESWVFIPPKGEYRYAGQLVLKSNTALYADPGYAGYLKATETTNSNVRLITNQAGAENVRMLNVRLDGGHDGTCWGDSATYGTPNHGAFFYDVTNLQVSGCHFYRIPGIAIGYQKFNGFQCLNNITEESGRDGITGWLFDGIGTNATISGNMIIKPGDDAFALNNDDIGTSCTVSNTGASVTATSAVFTSDAVIGMRIAIANAGASSSTYEGVIVGRSSTTVVTVSPAPSASVSNKSCIFGWTRFTSINYSNNTVRGRTGTDSKGLGRMLIMHAAENCVFEDFAMTDSYGAGIILQDSDTSNLLRSKNITLRDGTINAAAKHSTGYTLNKDTIRIAGADNVELENIACTDVNGTDGTPFNATSSYSYTKTNVTFAGYPAYDGNYP